MVSDAVSALSSLVKATLNPEPRFDGSNGGYRKDKGPLQPVRRLGETDQLRWNGYSTGSIDAAGQGHDISGTVDQGTARSKLWTRRQTSIPPRRIPSTTSCTG
jgi:hypothetical protein